MPKDNQDYYEEVHRPLNVLDKIRAEDAETKARRDLSFNTQVGEKMKADGRAVWNGQIPPSMINNAKPSLLGGVVKRFLPSAQAIPFFMKMEQREDKFFVPGVGAVTKYQYLKWLEGQRRLINPEVNNFNEFKPRVPLSARKSRVIADLEKQRNEMFGIEPEGGNI